LPSQFHRENGEHCRAKADKHIGAQARGFVLQLAFQPDESAQQRRQAQAQKDSGKQRCIGVQKRMAKQRVHLTPVANSSNAAGMETVTSWLLATGFWLPSHLEL